MYTTIFVDDKETLSALLDRVSNVEIQGQPSYFIESSEEGIELELYQPDGCRLCVRFDDIRSITICGDEEFIFIRIII